jgi:pilus assembly protein CpaF
MSEAAALRARVRAGAAPDQNEVAALARADVARLGIDGAERRRRELSARLLGLGPLEAVVRAGVTDVAVNADGSVWVDQGAGLVRHTVLLEGPEEVRALAVRLAGLAGRRLDDTAPYVDGLLPSGVRLHAVLPPLARGGAHITLRVPATRPLSLDDLVRCGSVPAGWDELVAMLVRRRVAFLVTGGTGSGKTTLLGALLGASAPADRIVLVEDVAELVVPGRHVVGLTARAPNVEGRGAVPMDVLVRQALRMRPDRLVVGEVRGAEVRELLTALNTGHEGGCGTVHANSPEDTLARLAALGALAGMSADAVAVQAASGLAVVLHMRRDGAHRRLDSWGVVRSGGAGGRGDIAVVRALDRSGRGPGWSRLAEVLGASEGSR